MGWFEDMFGGGAEKRAAEANRQLTQQYQTNALGAIGGAYNTATDYLKQGVSAYDPLVELGNKYNMAGDLYRDSLGVNGAEGNARATNAFQNNPGYSLAIDSALQGINRRRALGGMANSGNADIDALTYAQNLQNQQYNDWRSNLASAGQTGVGLIGAAAQGQAGGYTGLGSLATNYGQNQANIYGTATNNNIAANNQQAAGEAAGAKNLLGAGLSLASLVAAPFTGGLSLGGLGAALGGGGGGGAGTVFGGNMFGNLFGGNSGRISLGGPSGPTPLY